jgi:anthranilate/para-aminobenzoate synthase component I
MKQFAMCIFLLVILSVSSAGLVMPSSVNVVSPIIQPKIVQNTTANTTLSNVGTTMNTSLSVVQGVKEGSDVVSGTESDNLREAEEGLEELRSELEAKIAVVPSKTVQRGESAKRTNTTYEYDSQGRLVGYTETITENDSPEKTNKFTHILQYNSLGQVSKELIFDHETGEITDVDALRDALNGMDQMGPIYQAMYQMLQEGFEQKKDARDDAIIAQEQKASAAQEAAGSKKEEIEEKVDSAEEDFEEGPIHKSMFARAREWLLGNPEELADKLPGTMNNFSEKGEQFGSNETSPNTRERPSLFKRILLFWRY